MRDALLEGGLFVVIVLFLFVAELRTALVVLVSLPLTFLVTFIVMGRVGLTSNLMSLGGLAFSVGMVVDASIVVVENVRRHLARRVDGTPRRRIVAEAVQEVARPVAFSVLVIAVILVPLYALQGVEGKMFAPLASTMLIALLVSLAVALLFIPVLSELALTQAPEKELRFVRRIHAGYLSLLDRALARPRRTLGISAAVLVASGALVPFVGTEFMPPLDEGAIAINVVRLPNASLAGLGRGLPLPREAAQGLPGGGDGGLEDRPCRDLRGSDGAGADRRLRHAEAAAGLRTAAAPSAELVEAHAARPLGRSPACASPSRSRSPCG